MATREQIKAIETREQKYKQHKYADMYVSREVIMSEAFRKLTGTAIKVYLIFLTKRAMKPFEGGKSKRSGKGKYYIANQGEIQFSYREAQEKHGIIAHTFGRALEQLVEFGLIDITKSGTGTHRDASLYAISERWKDYGTDAFVAKKKPKRQQQYGFTKGNTYGRNSG